MGRHQLSEPILGQESLSKALRGYRTYGARLVWGFGVKVSRDDVYDWEKCTGILAAQAPMWEPGSRRGYHPLTQGYLVGELVRRITGKSIGAVFREEFAEPLGADFHIGLAESEDYRVADMVPPPEPLTKGMSEETTEIYENPGLHPEDTRLRSWRGAEMPAVNGTANARGMAKVMAVLANDGEVDGRRYLSAAASRRAFEVAFEGFDHLTGDVPARTSIEFGLRDARAGAIIDLPHDDMIWGGGFGGSFLVVDRKNRTSFGYAMNKMHGGIHSMDWGRGLARSLWQAQGIIAG